MKLTLNSLKLRDFAGISEEKFIFGSKDASIYGDNGAGKTTIAVALNWLLFDKGLENQKVDIVPKDSDNNHIHERVPTVTATFNMDGNLMTLTRESHPNYEKVEGSTKKHYKNSRTTKQYIDDVPFPITKYKQEINGIIDESVFQLVTNPEAFPQLHWQDKRRMLFEIAGDVSDKAVIESSQELKPLLEDINNRSIDDHKKVIDEKLKKAKKDLEYIPVQIQTLNDQLPDVTDLPEKVTIDDKIVTLDTQISTLQSKKSDIENGGSIVDIKRQISDKQYELDNLKRDLEQDSKDKVSGLKREIGSLEADVSIINSNIKRVNDEIDGLKQQKDKLLGKHQHLKSERDKVEAERFNSDVQDTCPTCGQPLEAHKVEEAKEHALAEFNKKKSQRLEDIEQELEQNVKSGKATASAIENNKEKRNDYDTQMDEIERKLKLKQGQLEKAESNVVHAEETDKYKEIQKEIKELQSHLENEKETISEGVEGINTAIDEKQSEIKGLRNQIAEYESAERIRKSIDDYRKQEDSLLDTIEDLKHQKHLIDQFTKTKVNLITEKVNSMFDLARFKLFHTQVNGDIKETCEIMSNGVTYDGGLNNAMRINTGVDICNVISKHYDVELFQFIDNAESVTDLKESEGQQIKLIVSEQDKQLRMEIE